MEKFKKQPRLLLARPRKTLASKNCKQELMKAMKGCFTSLTRSKLISRVSTRVLKESIESTGIHMTGRAGQGEAKRAMARLIWET